MHVVRKAAEALCRAPSSGSIDLIVIYSNKIKFMSPKPQIYLLISKLLLNYLELRYKCDFQKHEWETSGLKFFVSQGLHR